MTDVAKQSPLPADKLTRVPVRQVWFHDTFTFVGLDSRYSTISNLKCLKDNDNETRFVTAEFIPAWQMFEFHFHSLNNNKDEVRIRRVHASRVASWQSEDGAR